MSKLLQIFEVYRTKSYLLKVKKLNGYTFKLRLNDQINLLTFLKMALFLKFNKKFKNVI